MNLPWVEKNAICDFSNFDFFTPFLSILTLLGPGLFLMYVGRGGPNRPPPQKHTSTCCKDFKLGQMLDSDKKMTFANFLLNDAITRYFTDQIRSKLGICRPDFKQLYFA